MSFESFKHKAAKRRLHDWLVLREWGNAPQLEWPLVYDGREPIDWYERLGFVPSYEVCRQASYRVEAIFDVAMVKLASKTAAIDLGDLGYYPPEREPPYVWMAFEVVHRNWPTEKKRSVARQHGIDMRIVDAEWLLTAPRLPSDIFEIGWQMPQ